MPVILIAAMAKNRVIGYRGDIPWKIPGEQLLFKKLTLGHVVVMGRKTYESIGRPLPQRKNIIVTRNTEFQADGCQVVHSLSSAIDLFQTRKLFIIGGHDIFKQSIPLADEIYLSILHRSFHGDRFFPDFSESDYDLVYSEQIEAIIPYTFCHYIKKGTSYVHKT